MPRVHMLASTAATARPRHPVRRAAARPRHTARRAAAAVLWLYHLGADFVFYVFLAAVQAGCIGGVFPEILGRWVGGEGSLVSAAGKQVFACSKCVVLRLLPVFLMQFMVRVIGRVQFEAKEREKRRASSSVTTVASSQDQFTESGGAHHMVRKRFKLIAVMTTPLCELMGLGIKIREVNEEGSRWWRVGCVPLDVAWLSYAVLIGFVFVPNMLIAAKVLRSRDGDTVSQ